MAFVFKVTHYISNKIY